MDTTLLIMVARISIRFGTGTKLLEPVDVTNHIIKDYSIYDAIETGFKYVAFIIRKDVEKGHKCSYCLNLLVPQCDCGLCFSEYL